MLKLIMDYYGTEAFRCIKKGRPIDDIIISWQVTIIFFVFNFQSIVYLTLLLSKLLFKNSFIWFFYKNHINEFMIFFAGFSLSSFLIFNLYVKINKIKDRINPYDYSSKVAFFNWYGNLSFIIILVVFYAMYNMM